jgi:hypothetical protein
LYNNGDWYIGKIKDMKRHGIKGTYYYTNGDFYIGEWNEGMKHGLGELKFNNNSSFNGKFKDDQFLTGVYKDEIGNVFKTLRHTQ